MTWLRTREVKPGVYETSSLGVHVAKHVGILVAAPLALVFVGAVFAGAVGFWFDGEWELARNCTIAAVFIGLLAWYHSYYNKKHPEERGAKSHRGPWDC